jgi:hypothetical protein
VPLIFAPPSGFIAKKKRCREIPAAAMHKLFALPLQPPPIIAAQRRVSMIMVRRSVRRYLPLSLPLAHPPLSEHPPQLPPHAIAGPDTIPIIMKTTRTPVKNFTLFLLNLN